ncbi:arginine--tRNA ligase [Immundisolibacter cernigliae]|uniref:Arginine--tRNA ligase n=1 Tax=Immundisolibacter cernigliae TaxID=1810504 RepID=A0A1B1YRM3_9GAMM|nr:arginine--tRNA ligase [Immundisolibacter cernigliae]ANX03440.1 arginine--tRNA ligase [Immundisolibacter cernigliae]
MRSLLQSLIARALTRLHEDGVLPDVSPPDKVHIERARDKAHGDFASNVAMTLGKAARTAPRALAERIVAALPATDAVLRVEIAGPGFINFHLQPTAQLGVLLDVLAASDAYGQSRIGNGQRVQVEFVSANPTGPLHVGHGRGAAYGSSLANLLSTAGFEVEREYYVNDAGRQMDILAVSVWLRYLEFLGQELPFPAGAYRGDYVRAIAAALEQHVADGFRRTASEVLDGLPPDGPQGGDVDQYLDALIARAKLLLGSVDYGRLHRHGCDTILADIDDDLSAFGVSFDRWFRESSLVDSGALDRAIQALRAGDHLYQKDGAWWFRATAFGDRQDRVVIRENGEPTYFASDVAYHLDKLNRGFDRIIDIWGADHHGYMDRIRASLRALHGDDSPLTVLLVQFAVLYRGLEKVSMSTRSGEFVTLRELRDEVGSDAARFFYVLRKCDQHLDFDLELARSSSNDNPVYYVQYAHARIGAVLRQLAERGLKYEQPAPEALALLAEHPELDLAAALARYPELIESAALAHEPHQIAYYLRELAGLFHAYYNNHPFLVDDADLRNARLALVLAVRQVLRNGLRVLGVSAPEQM